MALNEESRLLSMRIPQNFVRETKGKWDRSQWQRLVQRIRRAGFNKIQEARLKTLVEDNRERWLSGDNSVGPPPAGAKVEGKAVERKERKMPERRPEPPRAAPPRAAAPAAAPPRAAPARPAPGKPVAAAVSAKDVPIDSAEAQEHQTRRLARLKRSLDLVNELTDMETDIRRLENTQTELTRAMDKFERQRGPLEKQRKTLQDEVDKATKDIGALRSSIEKLLTTRAGLEESVGHCRRERSEHVAAIAGFKAEKDGLIT